MKEINIDWDGPFTHDEVKEMNSKKDYGIYQFYGAHPVYGVDTLLYIGRTKECTFSNRMECGEHEQCLDKYWTPDNMTIFIGRLAGEKTPSDADWSKEIELAEKLLIFAHSPAWNSQELNLSIYEGGELFDIHVINWGKHKRLLPEVSGRRYALNYPRPENYNIYSL